MEAGKLMKETKKALILPNKLFLCLIFAALFSGCDWDMDFKTFDYNLRGTWESLDWYKDRLRITMDTIRIIPSGSFIPGLNGYTPNTAIEGYSEELPDDSVGYGQKGSLFIKDRGDWQTAVPYKLWGTYSEPKLTIGDDSIPTATARYTTFIRLND